MAKTTAPLEPLYEMDGACERLRCSPPTLYRLDDDGEITLLKIRGKTLVAGVEALIARQLEAAEQRRLTAEAPGGVVEQSSSGARRGRKRRVETSPDAFLASLPNGAD